jgi:hypothetical protein
VELIKEIKYLDGNTAYYVVEVKWWLNLIING